MTPLQLARDHLDPDAPAEIYKAVNAALEAENPDLAAVLAEMERTVAKYGHRLDMADGTGALLSDVLAKNAKKVCDEAGDQATAADIFREEAYEVLAETDPARLYAELTQVVSVGLLWMGRLRMRGAS